MKRLLLLAVIGCGLAGATQANPPAGPVPAPMGMQPVPAAPGAVAPAAPVTGVVTGDCGGGGDCTGAGVARHDARFGWSPLLRKLAFWKRDNGCGTCGVGGCGLLSRLRGLCGGGQAGTFNPYPNGVPGTLVFPQHPFVRSPRDFFMMDGR